MTDIDKGKEQTGLPRVPGTISENTLKAWILNARILGQSLQDTIPVFIPTYQAIRRDVLREFIRNPRRAVDEGMAEIKLRPPRNDIPHFDKTKIEERQRIEEMQRAGLWHMVNKLRIERGEEIPERTLEVGTFDRKNVALFFPPGPNIVPIPHLLSIHIVDLYLKDPQSVFPFEDLEVLALKSDPLTSVEEQMETVAKNVDALNTLGFRRELQRQNGIYRLAPKAT